MKLIQYIYTFLYMLAFLLLLNACATPTVFGVPKAEWQQLTPVQRKAAIKGYNERQKIKEQNAPLEDIISATGAVIQQKNAEKAWNRFSHHKFKIPPMP